MVNVMDTVKETSKTSEIKDLIRKIGADLSLIHI